MRVGNYEASMRRRLLFCSDFFVSVLLVGCQGGAGINTASHPCHMQVLTRCTAVLAERFLGFIRAALLL